MSKNQIIIESIASYMKYIEENCEIDWVLFRGQRSDWPLLPKLSRITLVNNLISVEKEMISAFKRQSIPYLDNIPVSDWDWLALAQHHGMATRLLDWTQNPLTALWFAVEKPPEKDKNGKELDGVIWVFKPQDKDFVSPEDLENDPYNLSRTKVFRPNHITKRITNQAGWFTVHKFISKSGRFIRLETNKSYKKTLTKLIIPASSFATMRFFLDKCNINASSLFADLDGICRHIEWKYSYLPDEEDQEAAG